MKCRCRFLEYGKRQLVGADSITVLVIVVANVFTLETKRS